MREDAMAGAHHHVRASLQSVIFAVAVCNPPTTPILDPTVAQFEKVLPQAEKEKDEQEK
jgi:hypothetical protein